MYTKECQDDRIINHSLEIVEIQSFKQLLAREGEDFLKQHYTSLECSVTDAGERWIQYLAGRWAAKSVITNCLTKGESQSANLTNKNHDPSSSWLNIEISRLPTGQPLVKLFGKYQERATQLEIKQWLLSISHTAIYAVASAAVVVRNSRF
jgi:holo-[acyl-carrier protein] synthase